MGRRVGYTERVVNLFCDDINYIMVEWKLSIINTSTNIAI